MKNLLFFVFLVSAMTSQAQDRLFTYTYQSNVLNKGQKELEVWTTMRNMRVNFYRAVDHRLEFEVGLGSKLQTAFYLNYGYSKSIETTNKIETLESKNSYSFANEWKLKLSDPVVNPIGSALYFEYTIATDEIELESKLILDKQIGKTIQAFNLVGEYASASEFESDSGKVQMENENEFELKLNYGFSYQINKNFYVDLEIFNKNKFESKEWKYSVLSAGPGLSYNFEGFWLNFTLFPQITNFKSGTPELVKNEKIQTRLIFSYVF